MYQARASTASVAAALRDVASLGGFSTLRFGGPDAGRHPVARSYVAGSTDLAEAVARRHRTVERRIDVSLAGLGHAARLASPALACVVLHGIVPDLEGLSGPTTDRPSGCPARLAGTPTGSPTVPSAPCTRG
ncbi:hypothetical protein ACPCAG_18335 [Streptomyces pseudogriseolus]|uniref:hypothetical protein n=1 Tax=Streptomyces pseudogriseolus TaxID=36817 RepID=UPI003FA282E5